MKQLIIGYDDGAVRYSDMKCERLLKVQEERYTLKCRAAGPLKNATRREEHRLRRIVRLAPGEVQHLRAKVNG